MLELAAEAYFARRPTRRINISNTQTDEKIAHGLVRRIFLQKGRRHPTIGIYLIPSFYNPKKFKKEDFAYRYISGDVIHYKQEFDKLQLRLEALVKDLS